MLRIITDENASASKQLDLLENLARRKPAAPVVRSRIESASVEHSIEQSGMEAFLVSSSGDSVDAVLSADDKHLKRHVRMTRCRIAQHGSSFDFSQIDRQYFRFRSKLIATLLDEPIEDGVTHPAEHVIDEALGASHSECLDWLSTVLIENYDTRPSLSAAIVRCIGSLEYDQVGPWGMRMADDALQHKHVEVRDAAVRALEAWGGCEALDMLRKHSDSVAWMNEYVRQVIVDLSGTAS